MGNEADAEAEIAALRRELAEANAALKQSQNSERLLVEANPDIIVLTQTDGTVIDVNETTLRALKVRREDFIGHCAFDFFPPAVAKGRRAMTEELLRTRQPVVRVDQNGPRVVENRVIPILDSNGEVGRMAVYSRDITQQARAEEMLLEQEKRRHHAEKMEALGRLASGIAHDFNNLLTPIIAFMSLSSEAADPSGTGGSLLRTARESGERAAALVQRILRYGREGERTLEDVSLADLAEEAARLTHSAFPGRVNVEVERPADLPMVHIDVGQIHQALLNLCMNAGQAVEATTGSVRVRLEPTETPEPGIRTHVIDDGGGISDKILPRIFDPFFSTKSKEEGSGLGLFTAHGAVMAHGGSLTVRNEPQGGAHFEMWLPIGATRERARRDSESAPANPTSSGLHVLAVDDEFGVLQAIEACLRVAGHQSAIAETVEEAIERWRSAMQPFDALVVDQNLREETGLELAERLLDLQPSLRVVVVTGRPTEEVRRRTERIGGVLVAKPFTAKALNAALTREPLP